MCVPAHDDRDFEFATKFGIPIVQVIAKDGKEIENMTEATLRLEVLMEALLPAQVHSHSPGSG